MGLKLNIGCGQKHLDNVANIDIVPPADIIHDCSTPLPFEENSVDEIKALHVIEHLLNGKEVIDRDAEYQAILTNWLGVLKPGGRLELAFPDVVLWAHLYEAGYVSYQDFITALYGGDGTVSMRHAYGFTSSEMIDHLRRAGFVNVRAISSKGVSDLGFGWSAKHLKSVWGISKSGALSGHVGVEAFK